MRTLTRLTALMIVIVLMGCTTVPVTGRRSFAILPSSELASMSIESYKKVLDEATLSEDQAQIDFVVSVGERLARATETYLQLNDFSTENLAWEFNVIKEDDTVNAWAMPGGKIAVYTGILPIAQDADGLATVLGHEIGHAIAAHGNERMSQAMMVQLGGVALSTATRNQPGKTSNIFMQSYGAASSVGLLLPYSRLHETEADTIGLTLMAMAGYDPRAAIPFWERMNASGGNRPPQFLSTHPAPATRIQNIREHLPEAMAVYAEE